MSLNYQLTLSRESLKFLKKQEKSFQQRISNALKGLAVRPPIGDIKPIKGRDNLLRLRVGTYRILFEVNHIEKVVYILTIDNRGDVYKKFLRHFSKVSFFVELLTNISKIKQK